MSRSLTIIDVDYKNWVKELSQRYRRSQIKAAVKVNNEVLKFYWELGRDIVGMDADNKYGSGFYKCLSNDLKEELPGVDGLSPSNLRYTKRFYLLYNELVGNFQQLAENSDDTNLFERGQGSDQFQIYSPCCNQCSAQGVSHKTAQKLKDGVLAQPVAHRPGLLPAPGLSEEFPGPSIKALF